MNPRADVCYFCEKRLKSGERTVLIKSGRKPDYSHERCVPKMFRLKGR